MRKLFLAAVGAASLLLGACGSTESGTITLTLQNLDCRTGSTSADAALQQAATIEVTVRGPGMDDLTRSAPVSAGGLDLPEIPAGKDREVLVHATNGSGVVVAVGHSAKFEVKADKDLAVEVPLVGLNRVHATAKVDDPLVCTEPSMPRAGHSAAAFSDGRVLLVGGFQVNQEASGPLVSYLDTVEIYEPATGGFRSLGNLPPICGPQGDQTCERAFAPAVVQKLPNNGGERLLVIGGEYRDETGSPRARGEILKFDPATEQWSAIPLREPRRHHTATLVGSNVLFIVGGFGNPDPESGAIPVVAQVETLQNNQNATFAAGSVSRALHGAVATADGKLLVAGGVDENGTLPTTVLQMTPGSPSVSPLQAELTTGVIGPTLATFWNQLIIVGGIAIPDGDLTDPLARLPGYAGIPGTGSYGEILPLGADTSLRGASGSEFPFQVKRSFACTAPLDANRLLIAGGVSENGGVVDAGGSAVVLAWIDESQCQPRGCEDDFRCDGASSCVGGKCQLACTDDAGCGTKGSCSDAGICESDLTNAAHRCTAGSRSCFAGSDCVEGGHPERSWIGGSNSTSSKLETARAWAACTRLSDDQILITGGVSENPSRDTLGDAELYEITHAGR